MRGRRNRRVGPRQASVGPEESPRCRVFYLVSRATRWRPANRSAAPHPAHDCPQVMSHVAAINQLPCDSARFSPRSSPPLIERERLTVCRTCRRSAVSHKKGGRLYRRTRESQRAIFPVLPGMSWHGAETRKSSARVGNHASPVHDHARPRLGALRLRFRRNRYIAGDPDRR
jgi:hypothetical protein